MTIKHQIKYLKLKMVNSSEVKLKRVFWVVQEMAFLQRIYNDFSPDASSQFIDDLQNIITEYMKNSCFSVGISDLIANMKKQIMN